jgi:hypothetical protein
MGSFVFTNASNLNANPVVDATETHTPNGPAGAACARAPSISTRTAMTPSLGTFTIRGTGQALPHITATLNTDFTAIRWNDAAPIHTFPNFNITNSGDQTLSVTDVRSRAPTRATDDHHRRNHRNDRTGNAKMWTFTFNPAAAGARTG